MVAEHRAAHSSGIHPVDVDVANEKGQSIPIQVKAIRAGGGSWQFNASKYLDIEFDADRVQHVRGKKPLPIPDLVCVFVVVGETGRDEFYVCPLQFVQDFICGYYPTAKRRNDSTHSAISAKDLAQFRDNWSLIDQTLATVVRT